MTGTGKAAALRNNPGRPRIREATCDVCNLAISATASVLFALQERGTGPYSGMCGWYIARVHADPCGTGFLSDARIEGEPYQQRYCDGCGRVMLVRPGRRYRRIRKVCSGTCRQRRYRRRQQLTYDERLAGL